MSAEIHLNKTKNTINSAESITPRGAILDLSPIQDRKNYHQTISFLNKAKDRFEEVDWRGGLETENGRYSFEEVIELISDIYTKDTSPQLVSANDLLAIGEAFKFAGVEIKEDLLVYFRRKACQEVNNIQVAKREAEARKRVESWRRKLTVVAYAGAISLIPIAFTLAAKSREINLSVQFNPNIINNNDPRVAEVSSISLDDLGKGPDEKEETKSILSSIGGAVESFIKPTPLVEELDGYSIDNLWGFNFANPEVKKGEEIDPSKFLILEWDSEKVIEANEGNPVRVILYPVNDETRGGSFGWGCIHLPDKECSKQFDNFIVVSGHSGVVENTQGEKVELPMEQLRAFIEGYKLQTDAQSFSSSPEEGEITLEAIVGQYSGTWSREERDRIMEILEEERPTLTQGDYQAKVKTAQVRIEEADRDQLYRDWRQVVEIALRYDPDLGEKVNLEKPFLVFVTSGRRISGDRESGENHHNYTSSVILNFAGEGLSDG